MRKVDREAAQSFYNETPFRSGNTEVRVEGKKTMLLLFGNNIATLEDGTTLTITDCGWVTATTAARLNALHGVSLMRKRGEWILNDKMWDGSPTQIKLK